MSKANEKEIVPTRTGNAVELRVLVDTRGSVQKTRIAMGNRLDAIERGEDDADPMTHDLYQKWSDLFEALEKELDSDIAGYAKEFPIINRMVDVKGMGFVLAAKVVAMVDISRASSVSALWKFAGYGVDLEGKADRRKKGEKLVYNSRLKVTCFLVGESFIRSTSPYRSVYDSAVEYYVANRPDWTKGHRHRAAQRKMVKMWLSHLWLVWRTIEGLETNRPFVHEHLAHDSLRTPQEFGWDVDDLLPPNNGNS